MWHASNTGNGDINVQMIMKWPKTPLSALANIGLGKYELGFMMHFVKYFMTMV